jgi:hypothetical protein
MGYSTNTIQEGIELFNEGSRDIDNGRSESGRSKLQQAQEIFELCKDTHAEAKSWLAKTIQKLS